MYTRNSVSLEHAHMVNRGSDDGYLEIAKFELRARKIANRMDKVIAVIMQDNTYRQQAQFQIYPRPTINSINQMITSPAEADKIRAAALQEVEEIMAITFASRTQRPVAIVNTTTTHTVQSVPPTATSATKVVTIADCLDHGKPQRPTSPSFMMNAIPENCLGATANPLLIVNTGNDGNMNSFITQTLATNHQNHQDNQNTTAFDNNIPKANKQINARITEIANQGPSETTATNHHDCPVPDRCQFTNHGKHQYQSTYTNQNRSYTNNYNQNYNHTWGSHTDRTCNSCGTKGHIAKHCTKLSF